MPGRDAAVLTVSVAAQLSGMHPQTVRQYDRLGLVRARRTRGGGRRYSLDDVDRLLEIQRLSQREGINLAGIAQIIELQDENARLREQVDSLSRQLAAAREAVERQRLLDERVFAARADGTVLVMTRDELRSRPTSEERGEIGDRRVAAALSGSRRSTTGRKRLRPRPSRHLSQWKAVSPPHMTVAEHCGSSASLTRRS